MAESVLRLKVDNKEYDQKIKRATDGLLAMEKACRKVGGTLEVVEKDELDFVRALGRMESTATNAKGQMKEFTNAILDLQGMYSRMTEQEKNSQFGKALAASMEELKRRAAELRDRTSDLNEELNNMASDSSFTDSVNMMSKTVGSCASAMVAWSGDGKEMASVLKDIAKIETTVRAIESLNKALQRQNLTLLTNKWALLAAAIAAVGYTIAKMVNDSDRNLEILNTYIDSVGTHLKRISDEADFDIAIAEACGASKKELRDMRYEALKTRQELAKLAYDRASQKWNETHDHWYSNIPGIRNSDEQAQAKAAMDEARKMIEEADKDMNSYFRQNIVEDVRERHGRGSGGGGATAHAGRATVAPTFTAGIKVEKEEEAVLYDFTKKMNEQFKNVFATSPFEGLQEKVDNTMKDIKLEPLEISFEVDNKSLKKFLKETQLEKMQGTADDLSRAFSGAASAVQAFGQDSKEAAMAASALSFAGTIASLMASMAKAQMQNKLGIWEWIAGGLAGAAALGTMVSQMKSAKAQAFADGGEVGGSSFVSDRIPALLNSGEVVLNRNQVSSLTNGLQQNATVSAQPYVMGQQIFVGINNALKANGMGQLVTTKMR